RGHLGTLAQRGDRTQVPEALRPGALPAGGHRGLRGVVPGDVDQDGRDAGQCWLRCSVSSVNIDSTDYLQRGGTGGRRDEPDFERTESPQSASADRSSSLLKINGLASGRAGWCGFLRVRAERFELLRGLGGVEPCAKPM